MCLSSMGVKFSSDIDLLSKSVEESGVAYLHAPFFLAGLEECSTGA